MDLSLIKNLGLYDQTCSLKCRKLGLFLIWFCQKKIYREFFCKGLFYNVAAHLSFHTISFTIIVYFLWIDLSYLHKQCIKINLIWNTNGPIFIRFAFMIKTHALLIELCL